MSKIQSTELKKEKHAGGRPLMPVKTRIERKTFDLGVIENLAFHGYTDKELAEILKIDESTINRWKADQEFLRVLKNGKREADERVEKALYERATGYEHTDLFITQYQGQIVKEEIIKHYPPDTAAAFIWLKNRRGWRDKQEIAHSGEVKQASIDLSKLTNDELAQLSNMLKRINVPVEMENVKEEGK